MPILHSLVGAHKNECDGTSTVSSYKIDPKELEFRIARKQLLTPVVKGNSNICQLNQFAKQVVEQKCRKGGTE